MSTKLPFNSQGELVYRSPAVAGKYVFLNNTSGETAVIDAAREYTEVTIHALTEGSGGTPVFEGERVFTRGGDTIYCIGAN